ncbi:MAG: hypothetical protein WD512_09595, partial [Candidatus Paceibacterota bacterium]
GYYTYFSGGIAFNPPITDKVARKLDKIIKNIEPRGSNLEQHKNYTCPWEIRICNGRWRIEWDQCDKPYFYEEWIVLVVEELDKLGYKMCGHIFWRGNDFTDNGIIYVKDDGSNQVCILPAQYGKEDLRMILNGSDSWQYPYYEFVETPMIPDTSSSDSGSDSGSDSEVEKE